MRLCLQHASCSPLQQTTDEHRRDDLDGPSNLTQARQLDLIAYALEVCREQVQFTFA